MKKYTEILEVIKTLYTEIKEIEENQKSEIDRYYSTFKGMTLNEKVAYRKANTEAETEHMQIITEYQEIITNGKIKLKLLENNAKIALFNEVMPIALEVLQKYIGKPYGEKTKSKICNEIKERTNCYVYIHSNYCQTFYIVPIGEIGSTYSIECGTRYVNGENKPLLVGNKIQSVYMEDLELFYINSTYFDDLDETVKELKRLHAEAQKKQEELKELCSQFNKLSVEGIARLDYLHNINGII